ncbi:MAG: type IV pilus modification protein PilV [Oxalobacteraceae bacterium]|nr:type IV pilus modification protein PilV [Oxalobacteraceae bacterium]
MQRQQQVGASLIEVLVAMLLLSLGMLALGAMLSFAVQMPKLSSYRANAVNLASGYIERMRANPKGFGNGDYDLSSSYDGSQTILKSSICAYPDCNSSSLAAMDFDETKMAVRTELPAGGIYMLSDSSSGAVGTGNLWIMWNEPNTNAALDPSSSDNCPSAVADSDPKPRCLYVRFKI